MLFFSGEKNAFITDNRYVHKSVIHSRRREKKTKKEGKIKYEQKRKGRIDREETQKKEIKKLVKKEEIEKREGIIKINKGRD